MSSSQATSPQDTFSSPNSVVPRVPASLQMPDNLQEAPKVVEQNAGTTSTIAFARQPTSSFYGKVIVEEEEEEEEEEVKSNERGI